MGFPHLSLPPAPSLELWVQTFSCRKRPCGLRRFFFICHASTWSPFSQNSPKSGERRTMPIFSGIVDKSALYNTVKFLPSNICHVDNFCRKILKNLQNRQSPEMFKKFCDGKMCFPHLPWHPEPTLEFWWQRFWAKISSMPPGWTGWNNTLHKNGYFSPKLTMMPTGWGLV